MAAAALRAALPAPTGPDSGNRAYHGGALLVTDPDAARGHLAPGQVLPIRLARLAPDLGGGPDLDAGEDPASVRFGQLEFLRVGPAAVTFRAAFQQGDGSLGPARTLTLGLGQGADLDGCGRTDLSLEPPAKPLGARSIAYARLAFHCDPEHTALFALDPAACPGARYPYGISGVTPSGQFIFQSDALPLRPGAPGTARLAAGNLAVLPGAGDVLVDTGAGRIRPIDQVQARERGLDMTYGQPTTPFLFQEVFGAAFIRFRSANAAPEPGRRPLAHLVAFDTTRTLMDNAYGRLDLQAAAHLDASLDFTATINRRGMASHLAASLEESVRLAADYQAGQAWHQDFGTLSLANPKLLFTLSGIPVSLSLPVTCGLEADGDYRGRVLEGFRSTGSWHGTARLAAHWGWHDIRVEAPLPETRNDLAMEALPENHADLDGKARLRPWLAAAPSFGIADLLFGEFPLTFALEGALVGHGPSSGPIGVQLDAQCQVGLGLKLQLPVLGRVWGRRWPLYDWTGPLWSAPAQPAS
jgi:hypothetical protein